MTERRNVTAIGLTACDALGVPLPPTATDQPLARTDLPPDLYDADRVLILVLDSWGESNWQQVADHTPYLVALDRKYRIATLRSVLPSITPVNFTAIGTGAPLEVHKASTRYEKSAVPTVFHAATEAGKVSSIVGPADSSSVLILGPTASKCLVAQTKEDSNPEVALMLASHLHRDRPDLVLSQWLDLDTIGHKHYPFSREHLHTYEQTDRLLRHFVPFAQELGYWIFLTADHGMHEAANAGTGRHGDHGSSAPEDVLVPLWMIPPS